MTTMNIRMESVEHKAHTPYDYVMEKPARWMSTNPLTNFCMVTYAVPPERVRRYIPPGLELDTRRNARGEHAFVSAVLFLNDHIRLFPTLWPTFTFYQVNYRTYVRHKERPGVWFFRLMQASRMADFNRRVFGAPTFYAPMKQQCSLDAHGGTYRRYRFDSVASDHTLHLDVEPAPNFSNFDGLFASTGEMEAFLTSRPDGYFSNQRRPGITSLTVWHDPLRPHYGTAHTAQFSVLSELGLVPGEEQRTPYCVMLAPKTVLLGQLPKHFA